MAGVEVDFISSTTDVSIDLTGETEYDRLVREEIQYYSTIKVTDDLAEGGDHGSKAWTHNHDYVYKNIFGTTFWDEVARHANLHERPRILSLGCGHGGMELQVARRLKKPHELIAVDLNPAIFDDALARAKAEGLNVRFRCVDLNFIEIQPNSFDVIYAYASIHHVLNLEHLFSTLQRGLAKNGSLVILDIIGKTQVVFWKENVEFAAEQVRTMPLRYKPRQKLFWKNLAPWFDPYTIIPPYVEPSVQVGMEGIRQGEIEALIEHWFEPIKIYKYNSFMRLICTNPYLASRLDPARPEDREFLEGLMKLDYEQVQSGKLRPTEIFAVFKKR
jgi:SAM-dependent methyltransferase